MYRSVACGRVINYLVESGNLKGDKSTIYNIIKRYREGYSKQIVKQLMADTYVEVSTNKSKESKLVYRPRKDHPRKGKKRLDRHVWATPRITKLGDEDPAVHGIAKLESVIENLRVAQKIKEKNLSTHLPGISSWRAI